MKITTIIALAIPTMTGAAQARGPFFAIPHLYSTTGPVEVRHKAVGDVVGSAPLTIPTPIADAPDFDLTKMFPTTSSLVEIDAMSTGNDRIPFPQQDGSLNPDIHNPENGWVALMFSVTPDSALGNTVMTARQPDNGADLYGYFLPGSCVASGAGVPTAVVSQLLLEQGREHIGLDPGANIDAFDALGTWVRDNLPNNGNPLWRIDDFYFSVTAQSAAWLDGAGIQWQGAAVDPAVIYKITWNRTPPGSWSEPSVFRSKTELDLVGDQDLDALAICAIPNLGPQNEVVMFSTVDPPPANILMVQFLGSVGGSPTNTVVPVKDRFGAPIYLIDTGDIDGISVFDPEMTFNGSTYDLVYNTCYSIPVASADYDSAELSLDVVRVRPGAVKLSVAGLDPSDSGTLLLFAGPDSAITFWKAFAISNPSGTHAWSENAVLPSVNPYCNVWAVFVGNVNKYSWFVRIVP